MTLINCFDKDMRKRLSSFRNLLKYSCLWTFLLPESLQWRLFNNEIHKCHSFMLLHLIKLHRILSLFWLCVNSASDFRGEKTPSDHELYGHICEMMLFIISVINSQWQLIYNLSRHRVWLLWCMQPLSPALPLEPDLFTQWESEMVLLAWLLSSLHKLLELDERLQNKHNV